MVEVHDHTTSFKVAEARFTAGVGIAVDYLIARNNLDMANINLISAKYDFVLRKKVLDYYRICPFHNNIDKAAESNELLNKKRSKVILAIALHKNSRHFISKNYFTRKAFSASLQCFNSFIIAAADAVMVSFATNMPFSSIIFAKKGIFTCSTIGIM